VRIGGKTFALNKADKKVLGVCAGLSDMTGVDATIIRVALVLLVIAWPWALLAYGIAAVLARPEGSGRRSGRSSIAEEERLRALDLRMQAIDTYVAGTNSPLAKEIEELR